MCEKQKCVTCKYFDSLWFICNKIDFEYDLKKEVIGCNLGIRK